MTQSVTVRRLTPDDYDDLLGLWQASGLHSLRPEGRDSRDAVSRQLASGVLAILGLAVNDRLAGAVVTSHDSRKGWINRLVIHPNDRRRGYARRLIAAAEGVLRDAGIRVIAVLIESGNDASVALFQSAGYAEGDPGIHYLSKRESPAA